MKKYTLYLLIIISTVSCLGNHKKYSEKELDASLFMGDFIFTRNTKSTIFDSLKMIKKHDSILPKVINKNNPK